MPEGTREPSRGYLVKYRRLPLDLNTFYKITKQLSGQSNSYIKPVREKEGKVITTKRNRLQDGSSIFKKRLTGQNLMRLPTQTLRMTSTLTPTRPPRSKWSLKCNHWRMEKLQGLIRFKQNYQRQIPPVHPWGWGISLLRSGTMR